MQRLSANSNNPYMELSFFLLEYSSDLICERLNVNIPPVIRAAPIHSLVEYALCSKRRPTSITGMSLLDFARTAVGYETYLRDSFELTVATKKKKDVLMNNEWFRPCLASP